MEGGTLTLKAYAQVKTYLLVITLQFVFLDFISVPENNLSTSTVIAITAVICQLVAFIAETTVHKYVVIAYIYYIM